MRKYFTEESRLAAIREGSRRRYLASKESKSAYYKQWYIDNREKVLLKSREYYAANRDAVNKRTGARGKLDRQRHPQRFLAYRLRKYGWDIMKYNQVLADQDNRCAVCQAKFVHGAKGEGPHIDHCHVSNKVRGIICHNCNTALGLMKDSPITLQRALEYLTRGAAL